MSITERMARELLLYCGIEGLCLTTAREATHFVLAIPLNEVLALISEEERRVTSSEAAGTLFNLRNAVNAMMEEPTP